MQARRSIPADPGVANAGRWLRMRSSRIMTSMVKPFWFIVVSPPHCSSLAPRNPRGDFRDQSPRERELVHLGQRMRAGVVEQGHLALIRPQRILDAVGNNERDPLPA